LRLVKSPDAPKITIVSDIINTYQELKTDFAEQLKNKIRPSTPKMSILGKVSGLNEGTFRWGP